MSALEPEATGPDAGDELVPGDPRFEAILDERAKELARTSERTDATARGATHVTFDAGGIRFAIESAAVRRILLDVKLTRIPGASVGLEYVMHADGAVISVVDPARLVQRSATTKRPSVVLLEHHGRRLGLFVDRVTGLERPDLDTLDARVTDQDGRSPVLGTTASIVVVLDAATLVNTGGSSPTT